MLVPTLGLFTTTQEGVQVGVGVGGGAITRLTVEEAEVVIFAVPTRLFFPSAVKGWIADSSATHARALYSAMLEVLVTADLSPLADGLSRCIGSLIPRLQERLRQCHAF